MIWSLQQHHVLRPLVRPRQCRCTVLGALPQSSGQSAGLIPASVLPRARLLRAFKPLLGVSATAVHDLVNVAHLWILDSLLSRPQARLDCCCRQRRSDRLFLRGSDVSEVRLVLASFVLRGGMRDLVLHCLAATLLICTLFAAEASGCFCPEFIVALELPSFHPLWVRSFHPLWVRSFHPLWVRSFHPLWVRSFHSGARDPASLATACSPSTARLMES